MRLYCDHCFKEFASLNYEEYYPLQISTIKKIYREHRTSEECRSIMKPSYVRRRDASRDEDDLYFA